MTAKKLFPNLLVMLLVAANFIQHLPESPAACWGDEWLNIAFLRGAIPRQEGAGFILIIKHSVENLSIRFADKFQYSPCPAIKPGKRVIDKNVFARHLSAEFDDCSSARGNESRLHIFKHSAAY